MTDDGLFKEPPHDLAAERNTLGAMMLAENVIPDVYEHLGDQNDERRTAFYRPAHQMIYSAIMGVFDRGAKPDPTLVADELTKRGQLARTGGAPYLYGLYEGVPTVTNAGKYAEIVAEVHRARQVVELAERIDQAARKGLVDTARQFVADWTDAQRATGKAAPGQSWRPVDLGPILRGDHERPAPSVGLARSDGLRLLYPGKEHTVMGAMESGKSWFSTASCAAELTAGHHVLYVHFEEADPTDTVERLRTLGVQDHVIAERFRFVGPDEPVRAEFLAELLSPAPSLVVLDGVNEAMAMHGQAIREEDGAAAFRRLLVKPCTAVGAAVLGADHVVKDRERQGLGPLGSVHKGNGLSGSLVLLENAEPFGRGQRGRSYVFITKDRPGYLRGAGRADTKTPGKTFMGSLVVDDTRTQYSYLDLAFWAPAPKDDQDPGELKSKDAKDDERVLDVIRELIAAGETANKRTVRARSGISSPRTDAALTRLGLDGYIRIEPGAKNATNFIPIQEIS
ncbi:DnaB-like helicase N-terminal domain-containing protein [Actinomadura macrotermitis]|uniref:DNA helicase DnaB-like N-terminal domain-containing protein n=1 Tax=Actinomadura macrotermitis TaxID=2585200 RepID=A0A7K0BSW3_9ACTN|nr:DnaB-like helicase N-terminal domain-containing protein [Actinomadura macrotermitis]MQY04126.1 hypothetical protein [Actinomadura macrotermitis]